MSYPFETEDGFGVGAEYIRRKRQQIFVLLFLAGTIIAAAGWLAPVRHFERPLNIFRYSSLIAIAGHALQLVAVFGSMLTPDRIEQNEDAQGGTSSRTDQKNIDI